MPIDTEMIREALRSVVDPELQLNKLLVLLRFYGVERCAALMVEVNPPPVRLRQRRRPETGPRLLEEARPQLIPAALDLFPAETLASDKDLEQDFLLGVRVRATHTESLQRLTPSGSWPGLQGNPGQPG